MTVVSVSMPESLLNRLDEFAEEHGYTGRSEVVREASRNLLGEFEDKRLEDRDLIGVVTVLFNYETSMEIGAEMFDHMETAEGEVGMTECPTCAMQMEHGTGYEIKHPLQLLETALVD